MTLSSERIILSIVDVKKAILISILLVDFSHIHLPLMEELLANK
jgi:hypothetical protein